MTVTVANTLINNTWDFHRQRLNQIADVTTRQTVTVGGNSAVGDADITGSLRANTLYTYTLLGGSIANNQTLVIGSNINATANVTIGNSLVVTQNVTSNNIVALSKITVGNTVLNTANLYADFHYGSWAGNVIKPQFGGTGSNAIPANGTILIGNGNNYVNSLLTTTIGIQFTVGPGTIQIDNTGLTGFRTSTNTANVYTSWRSGNVTFTATDVVNALGFIPAPTSTSSWYNVGTDLNFYQGNVAIGYSDNNPRSYAKLQILQTDTATNLPGVLVENPGNNATSGAYVGLTVANTSSMSGVRFQSNRVNSGSIDYSVSSGRMTFTTANTVRLAIDNANNVGIGTSTPQPNKGGTGLHIVANNAGFTLDSGSGAQWHIGMNPNMATVSAGVRQVGQFGIFSDNANSGIYFSNTATSFILNGSVKTTFDATGSVRIATTNLAVGAMLQVGGDIVTEGSFANYSDYRLKNTITDLSAYDSIERIKSLRPVSFRWNENNHLEEGFIAHEVKEVISTAVKGVKDGFDFQTLDKSQITPTIVKALQALINIVEDQQQEIERLKSK